MITQGDQVYVLIKASNVNLIKIKGLYPITQVYTNGTMITLSGSVNEQINIRWLKPVFW